MILCFFSTITTFIQVILFLSTITTLSYDFFLMIYNFHPLLLHERGAPPWEFWVLLGLFFLYLSSFSFSVWVPLLSDVVSELRVVKPLVGQVALVITGVVQIFRVVRWGNGVVTGAFGF